MKKFLYPIPVILFLLACGQTKTSRDKQYKELEMTCDQIMTYFTKSNYPEVLRLLKEHSLLGSRAIDSLGRVIEQQMNNLDYRYGQPLSFRTIEDKSVEELITRRTYILFFEGNYLKFNFILYKSKFSWKITTFEYSQDIDDLLK